MIGEIDAADFVLVVCSDTYLRRFDGREQAGTGQVEKGWTISIGFAPITLIRNTIGGVKGFTQGKKTYKIEKAKPQN